MASTLMQALIMYFFDACKVSHEPCQFPRVSPVLWVISWASYNQVVRSALLTLPVDRDGKSSFYLWFNSPQEVEAILGLHVVDNDLRLSEKW